MMPKHRSRNAKFWDGHKKDRIHKTLGSHKSHKKHKLQKIFVSFCVFVAPPGIQYWRSATTGKWSEASLGTTQALTGLISRLTKM